MTALAILLSLAGLALAMGGGSDDVVEIQDDDPPIDDTTDTRDDNRSDTIDRDHNDGLDTVTPDDLGVVPDDTDEPLTRYTSGPTDGFNIDIEFHGDWTAAEQTDIVKSAEFLSAIIVDDIPDNNWPDVDDVKITVSKDPVDGVDGTLAYARPDDMRWDSHFPATASIVFDEDDVENLMQDGDWANTAFHEMLHAVGFGIVWDDQGLVRTTSDGVRRFTGTNAINVYTNEFEHSDADIHADKGVPLDRVAAHWNEDIFHNEIMTGELNGHEHVSNLTLAALEDMGYDTVYDDIRTDQITSDWPPNFVWQRGQTANPSQTIHPQSNMG